MLAVDMIIWWYGRGWIERVGALKDHLSNWAQYFSLGTLMLTLFQPWKQIVTATDGHSSLAARKNALVDNLVSRFIGFFIRISVFIFALLAMVSILLINAAYIVIWPIIPLSPILVILFGVSVA